MTQTGDRVNLQPVNNGRIVLNISAQETVLAEIALPNDAAGIIAGLLLSTAQNAHQRALQNNEPLPAKIGDVERVALRPNRVAVGASQTPGYEMLVFELGEASIGFDLPRSGLKELGEALMMLSAGGAAQ